MQQKAARFFGRVHYELYVDKAQQHLPLHTAEGREVTTTQTTLPLFAYGEVKGLQGSKFRAGCVLNNVEQLQSRRTNSMHAISSLFHFHRRPNSPSSSS